MAPNRRNILCLTVLLLVADMLSAQVTGRISRAENMRYWEVSAFSGPSVFMGDIKYYHLMPFREEWRFALGFSAGRRLSPLFGIKGMLLSGKLAGIQKSGNYRMESRFREMNISGLLYFDNLFGEKRTDRQVQIYLIAGVGLVFYNTDLFTRQPDRKVRNSGNRTEGILLIGLGMDFRINRQWSVSLESANRGMDSDYMDLWASGYPYDVYNVTTAGIKFRFGWSGQNNTYYPKAVIRRKLNRAF